MPLVVTGYFNLTNDVGEPYQEPVFRDFDEVKREIRDALETEFDAAIEAIYPRREMALMTTIAVEANDRPAKNAHENFIQSIMRLKMKTLNAVDEASTLDEARAVRVDISTLGPRPSRLVLVENRRVRARNA
jgi:hypothetical protein